MLDFRPIMFILGVLLSTLAGAMCLPAIADAVSGNKDWQVFAIAAGFTGFVGGLFIFTARAPMRGINVRQAFLLTALAWIIIPAFGALPMVFANLNLTYTDAFFEAMSGLTTTGSTVIVGLDDVQPGILLWRSLLQWLGGIGIIGMAIAIMPLLQVGGMQLFRMESSDKSEKVLPRATQLIAYIGFIYLFFTALCAFCYWLTGMSGFDAVAHAMTTIATGGFSTHDLSIGYFESAKIELIAIIFMLLGSLPFVLYLRAIRGNPGAFLRDTQVHWFLIIVLCTITAISLYLWRVNGIAPHIALKNSAFNVVSIITGTGYATKDFSAWGPFALATFLFLMFVGGCAGSTTCGIKVFRFQVLYASAVTQMRKLLQPHGVFLTYYNGRPISDDVGTSVMGFFFLYAVSFVVLAIGLGLIGLDFLTAISGAATAISNVGPGLGPTIGPSGTFLTLPDTAKWLLSFGMLLGRLELFTIFVLLAPSFWRA
ncbi:MAG: TrkH family potassium uptake protein [Proteobacteria bacterium]|nr:TrkH family potassium uptake protein [Pseudomonadota bacterium]